MVWFAKFCYTVLLYSRMGTIGLSHRMSLSSVNHLYSTWRALGEMIIRILTKERNLAVVIGWIGKSYEQCMTDWPAEAAVMKASDLLGMIKGNNKNMW